MTIFISSKKQYIEQFCNIRSSDLNKIYGQHGTMICLNWINIPLVYTQVVTLAVHTYFFLTLFSRQVGG